MKYSLKYVTVGNLGCAVVRDQVAQVLELSRSLRRLRRLFGAVEDRNPDRVQQNIELTGKRWRAVQLIRITDQQSASEEVFGDGDEATDQVGDTGCR